MIYQPLDVSRFEARLLRLLEAPSELDHPLRFELITYSLIRPPEYFAISYCWGDNTHQIPIEVDGEIIRVSENLGNALRQLDFKPGAMIWADAICVNQDDANEKAHQIRSMGLIYSKARATAVWLGKEEQDTRHACALLKEVRLEDQGQLSSVARSDFESNVKNTRYPTRSLRGLYELLTRPYWERVWIIQEIAKAQTVWVRCGSLCFDLAALIACSEHVNTLPQRSRILISAIQEFRLQELEARRGALRMTLLEALIRSRYFLATNSRDKIYALLNLARDGNDLVPTPTYTEPVEDVFRDLAMTFLHSPHPIEAAILSLWAPLNVRPGAWPSWAVDWADLASTVPPWLASNLQARFNQSWKEKGFGDPSISSASVELHGQGQCSQIIPESGLVQALAYIAKCARKPYIEDVLRHLGPLMRDPFYLRTWEKELSAYEEAVEEVEQSLPRNKLVLQQTDKSRGFVSGKSQNEPLDNADFSLSVDSRIPQERRPLAVDKFCLAGIQALDDAFSNLHLSPEYGLRFATSRNNLILVPRAAEEGDRIYRLDSCYLPLILRVIPNQPQGTFKIIGEACVGIGFDGDWIAARDCPWLGESKTESLNLVV
ncbi:HET-domain-containing protein [Hypoxylon sp. FL0543]|nr:HET-domain-containing protein [Hypoxylon sp. FL0543]